MIRKNSAALLLCAAASVAVSAAGDATLAIKVDQVGYLTAAPKIALVAAPAAALILPRACSEESARS